MYIIASAVVFAALIIGVGIFFGDSQSGSNNSSIVAAAETAGVNTDEFETCLNSDSFQSKVQTDLENARSAGGEGTPFNVITFSDPLSSSTQAQISSQSSRLSISEDGKRLSAGGAIPYEAMTRIIDLALQDPRSTTATSTTTGTTTVDASSDIAINSVTESDHIRGNSSATVTVVEYSDFKCPHCGQFHSTMKQIMNDYEDDEVAWVYRHFPLSRLHPQAPRIARASECVADQGGDEAFWTFADEIFAGN
jgi:protein-disulfide isomerase